MTKLPNGWEVKKLEEVATIVTGNTPSKKNLDFYGNDYPFFKPSDFDSTYELTTAGDNLSSLGFKNARQLPPKTILVVCIGSLGKVGLTRVQGSCNQQINAIIPNDNLLSEYVYYFCISSSFQKTMFLQAPKTTLPILNKKEFSKLTITLPPLEEQRKIVKILDEKFASIDESIRLAKDDLLSLDELWQSILNDSFNPLKSKLDDVKYPKTWEIKKIDDLCEILDSKRVPISQKDRKSGKYPYYGATGIVDYIDNYIFDEELVLVGEDGAKWGACENTAFIASGKYWVNNHAHVLKPIESKIKNKFLVYYLNYADLEDYITGATVKKLNQQKLKQIQIPLPPLKEQECITKELESKASIIKELKELYAKRLKDYEELKESLLDLAFKGGL